MSYRGARIIRPGRRRRSFSAAVLCSTISYLPFIFSPPPTLPPSTVFARWIAADTAARALHRKKLLELQQQQPERGSVYFRILRHGCSMYPGNELSGFFTLEIIFRPRSSANNRSDSGELFCLPGRAEWELEVICKSLQTNSVHS